MTTTTITTITATATPTANAIATATATATATTTHPMEKALHQMKIMRDYQINSNIFFVKKETFKQKKLSCPNHGKRNPKWWDKRHKKW
jgi:hypothetical protein